MPIARMAALISTALLGAALVVAVDSPASARPPTAGSVTAFPGPGDSLAQPHTSLTFRGTDPAALQGISVVGSRSGVHHGALRALADGRGSTFRPTSAFVPGETVTVDAGVPVSGRSTSYRFTVARPATAPNTVPDESAATGTPKAATSCTPRATFSFHSRPDLHPSGTCVLARTAAAAPGYLLTTPGGESGGGPTIYDDAGQPVWYQPQSSPVVHDLKVVRVDGQDPLLAFYAGPRGDDPGHGAGHYTLLDQHYQAAGQISAGNGYTTADFHEMLVTPRGTAYVGIYNPVHMTIGGSDRIVYDYVVQEVDYQHRNDVLFEWHSLDHVPTGESHVPLPATGPWDYFHGNSIAEDSDGNVLISARNTWTVYKVDRTGKIVWKLGDPADHSGSFGTLAQSPAGWFCYQHDARVAVENGVTYYTVYDDGGGGPGCNHAARGLKFTLDPGSGTATLVKGYHHSPDIYTQFTGSTRLQPNGNLLVGWANVPQLTEFTGNGSVALDLRFAAASYRSIREEWHGYPVVPPDLSVQRSGSGATAYASWNGATEVASWQLLAGDSASALQPVGARVPRHGFETALPVPANATVIEVEALDAAGNVLDHGTSEATAGARFFTEHGAGPPYYRNDYRMIVGDFGGSDADDILAYTPGSGPDYLSISDGNGGWTQQLLPQIARTWTPLVGNFVGDSHEEIIWWDPVDTTAHLARAPFTAPWRPIQVPPVRHAEVLDNGPRSGDAVYDEILWWGPSARIAQVEHFSWPAGADLTVHRRNVGPLRYEFQPLVGDFDGNGFADVLWYGPGAIPDWVWYFDGTQPGTTTSYDSRSVYLGRTGYQPVVGRFGPPDGADDVLFYTPGTGIDWLWRGGSGRAFTSTNVTTAETGTAMTVQRDDAASDTVALWRPGADVRMWRFGSRSGVGAVEQAGNTILAAGYHPSVGRLAGGVDCVYWYAAGTAPERLWRPAG